MYSRPKGNQMANKEKVAVGRRGFLQALAIGAAGTVEAGAEQLAPLRLRRLAESRQQLLPPRCLWPGSICA